MRLASLFLFLGFLFVISAGLLLAADAPPAPAVPLAKIAGMVAITEDADWNITAVKVTADDNTVYQIVLDENGKRLGNEEDGQRAEVLGALAEKEGVKWFTVAGFKELPQ